MLLPKKFRQWVANYILRKRLTKLQREKHFFAWDTFQSIGIVARIDTEEDYNSIRNISSQLKKEGKEVQVIAYIPEKIIPDYLVSSGVGIFFNINDLSDFLIPKNDFVNGFIDSEPDILLDLSFSSSFVIKYIVSLSKAKMKIGDDNPSKKSYYDFMIKIEDESDIVHFVDQVKYYLSVIKAK